ncbi:MFS transporter [Streptomyces sp. ISL-36]|uniref:MFS transporter n=1 Tax=Streptomyces sp. ISL-36 TaxID=2819182 RepID=UPI001BE861F9|nr:MFS transporter [Streptomyces sp. ISL-36]MBT2441110.1 MFS transporter [Streptomyces sp. ISL-36]
MTASPDAHAHSHAHSADRTPAHTAGDTPAHTPGDTPAHSPAHPPAHSPAHPPADPPARSRRWTALALICVAQFMLILDVTVVNVALPRMAADLDLARTSLTWVVTAYTLCFGGLMLLGGRLADAFGARRTLLAGLALFTAASLLSGLAANAPMLIGGRIAQGVGAALLSPAALSLVTTSFHGAERAKALGVWAAIGGTGSAVGVLLGGVLTDGPGWPWVFYVNVPVGLALLVALPLVVPARTPRPADAPRPARGLDAPGAFLVTAATGSLIYGLVQAGDTGWTSASTLLPLLGSLLLYGIFAAVERASRAPLMDLRMFTRRPVLAGSFLMLVATALLISFFFLGSVQLQHLGGFSAFTTGLVFLPVAVTTAVGAHLGSRLVGSLGPRACATGGMAIAALGCLPLALVTPGSHPWTTLMPALSVASLGLGAVFVTATTTALGMIDHHEAGLASGIVNTFHEVGGSIGVALVSTTAATSIQGTTTTGFTAAFTLCAATAAAAALAAPALVPRGKPRMTGGPHVH